MSDINHRGYHARLEQLKRISQRYHLQVSNITPVAYQEVGRFPYNNFIYKVELTQPADGSIFNGPDEIYKPCTTIPPDGTSAYILRMSNPEAMGINPRSSRTENEVAAMFLARQGLDNFQPGFGDLIPAVYAFCSEPTLPGDLPWILMEYKAGIPLDDFFDSQFLEMKESIIDQISDVFSGLRKCPIPPGVDSYGGLGIAKDGIKSAEMTITYGGPWPTYEMLLKARLKHELHDADLSPIIKGWHENGVRERLQTLIDKFTLCELNQKVLIHGDLNPAHEFLVSLQDLGGNVTGPYGKDPTNGKLSQAILSGDFSEDIPGDLWWNRKTLSSSLAKRGIQQPSGIPGIEMLLQFRALESLICPFHLAVPFMIQDMSDEQRATAREVAESKLIAQIEVVDKALSAEF